MPKMVDLLIKIQTKTFAYLDSPSYGHPFYYLLLLCCLTSTVNIYGHVGTVS